MDFFFGSIYPHSPSSETSGAHNNLSNTHSNVDCKADYSHECECTLVDKCDQ